MFNHKSHRLVRVTPLLGRIIDEYMRPELINIVRPVQNSNQYGFTETVSYLMGALQRHEVEKYCIDMKKTYFGCSLDGDSAFEVVKYSNERTFPCRGSRSILALFLQQAQSADRCVRVEVLTSSLAFFFFKF